MNEKRPVNAHELEAPTWVLAFLVFLLLVGIAIVGVATYSTTVQEIEQSDEKARLDRAWNEAEHLRAEKACGHVRCPAGKQCFLTERGTACVNSGVRR